MKQVKQILVLSVLVFLFALGNQVQASETVRVNATILKASNDGSDFNLDNDAFRDQLIQLFSYSAYEQVEVRALDLPKSGQVELELLEGYTLNLILQEAKSDKIGVEALVLKADKQYVSTVLSLSRPGVVFVGGPPLENGGALIIVLESTGN